MTVSRGACLSPESIGKALRAWRGRASIDRRIRFVVREQPESKQVQILVLRDGEDIGDRSFDVSGRPCEEIARMVSLSIAVTLDQLQLTEQLERPPPQEKEPSRSDEKEPPPSRAGGAERQTANSTLRPSIRAARKQTRQWELLVVAPRTDIAIGILPDVGVGLSAGAGVRYRRHFQGVVYAKALHSQPATFGPGTLETLLVLASAEGCLRQDFGRAGLRAAACASLSHGTLRGESSGFADARAATLSYWAAGVGGKLELAIGPKVSFALAGEMVFPLAPPRFDLAPRGSSASVIWRPPGVGIVVSFGPQFEF